MFSLTLFELQLELQQMYPIKEKLLQKVTFSMIYNEIFLPPKM